MGLREAGIFNSIRHPPHVRVDFQGHHEELYLFGKKKIQLQTAKLLSNKVLIDDT